MKRVHLNMYTEQFHHLPEKGGWNMIPQSQPHHHYHHYQPNLQYQHIIPYQQIQGKQYYTHNQQPRDIVNYQYQQNYQNSHSNHSYNIASNNYLINNNTNNIITKNKHRLLPEYTECQTKIQKQPQLQTQQQKYQTNLHRQQHSNLKNTTTSTTTTRRSIFELKQYNNNITYNYSSYKDNNHYPEVKKQILTTPTKMQREEIIIEHSQLVLGGGTENVSNENNLHKSHHYTQIIAALAVSLGPLAAGLGKGYSSPAIASLQELQIRHKGNYTTFSVTDQQASWVASLSLLGALFGGMFGGLAMQYGRKRVLALMSLPFSLSWILTVFAKSVETMFVTAFFGGFCCSIVSVVTQVYISEISSPDIRGFLSAIQKISGHLGILISFTLGAYLDWRQLAMLVSVAPIMLFITVIYVPETPSFLVLKGRDEEAFQSLKWLRGPNKNVELELDTIRSNIRTTKAISSNKTSTLGRLTTITTTSLTRTSLQNIFTNIKSVLKNVRLIKPVLITCGLMVFQRFTGANSFGFYAVKIFRQTFAGMNPHGGAIAVGFVQLLASMLSGLLIDTIGRIPLLIISSVFMSLALASFGSYVYYEQANKLIATNNFELDATSGNSDWIPLLCVLVFTIAFSLGISPISSLLVGELFPLEYRGIGSSIATSFSYFCAFLSVKTFVDFQELLGLHGAFWLYACISCVGLFFVIMFVPETKGKDLDEMDPKYIRTLTINR